MNLLLDTHVVLWWRANDARLGRAARDAIARADAVFVSAVSAWEIEIKRALGKVRLPEPFATGVAKSGFERLPIRFEHAARLATLPAHHTDPFDRMLVAQALEEQLRLVSADDQVLRYGVDGLDAR